MRVSLSDLPVNEVKSLIDLQHHVNVQHADVKCPARSTRDGLLQKFVRRG
jgi:hypothetical protein